MDSALYIGWLDHRRRGPRVHAFRYPLFMVLLDLDELDRVFTGRWLWGVERRTVASFRRADHMGDARLPLAQCVRDLVQRECGLRVDGPVRLLTQLRYFGYCFNPVSFYYCYDAGGGYLQTVVAEVNNTPWGERHCYVLPVAAAATATGAPSARQWSWRFDKDFHVSPFMPMDMQYDWRISELADTTAIHMSATQAGAELFNATLLLRRRPPTALNMALVLLRFPLMTLQVIAAIYWQALRLWLKGVSVHTHPRRLHEPESAALARQKQPG